MKKLSLLVLLLALVLAPVVGLAQNTNATATITPNEYARTVMASPSKPSLCYDFNRNLTIGSRGADVDALVRILMAEGLVVGDSDSIFVRGEDFNEGVAAAVVKFQAKYGILQSGFVGPITRAQLNKLYGCGKLPYPVPGPTSCTFNFNLTIGSSGDQVIRLQQILIKEGYLTMPADFALGYFGILTKNALARWEQAHNIAPAIGFFGPATRAVFNSLYPCDPIPVGQPTITTTYLPNGVVGQAYNQTIATSGFTNGNDMIWTQFGKSNDLPPGLTLQKQTIYCFRAPCPVSTSATISGTPTGLPGSYTFTITASQKLANGNVISDNQTYTINITNGSVDPCNLPNGGICPSRSVKIISPNGGEMWDVADTNTLHKISWVSTGYPDNAWLQVGIYDTRYGLDYDPIQLGGTIPFVKDGERTFRLPPNVPPGNNYRAWIGVSTSPLGSPIDESDSSFAITSGSSNTTSYIRFNYPLGGEVWKRGDRVRFTWDSSSDNRTVNIAFFQGARREWIAYGIPNNGYFDWTIPSNFTLANDYSFGINSPNQPNGDWVKNTLVTITDGSSPLPGGNQAYLNINPLSASPAVIGNSYTITWNTNLIPADYRHRSVALLDQNNNVVALIADETTAGWAGLSQFTWKVGTMFNGANSVRPGTYRVRVQYDDAFGVVGLPASIHGDAGVIVVTGTPDPTGQVVSVSISRANGSAIPVPTPTSHGVFRTDVVNVGWSAPSGDYTVDYIGLVDANTGNAAGIISEARNNTSVFSWTAGNSIFGSVSDGTYKIRVGLKNVRTGTVITGDSQAFRMVSV